MPENSHQATTPFISAIVPIYNEQLNVASVLTVLNNADILDEIILVDDGSTDNSLEIITQAVKQDARMRVIRHERNRGKGQAIFSGWENCDASVILLLDADLKNLSETHINDLLTPVVENQADMTLGLFKGGHWATDASHRLTPFLTGQRGVRAEILKYVSPTAAAGYGFEVALTVAAGQHNYRSQVVSLNGVWHPQSEFREERGFFHGAIWKLRMYGQIVRAWYISTRERSAKTKGVLSDISEP